MAEITGSTIGFTTRGRHRRGEMKLFLLTQDVNDDFDTYDACVVAAATEAEARVTMPRKSERYPATLDQWTTPEKVTVKYIGEAAKDVAEGVICASFNAG